MEKLKAYFIQAGFSEIDVEKITNVFHFKQFNKGDFFIKEGKITNQLAFIDEGSFQYYSLSKGEERTTYIALQNSFVASLLSYLREIPSRENIRALTKATLWIIDKKNVVKLQNEVPAFKEFYIGLIEWQICCIDKSKFDLLTLTADERYKKLMEEEPEILQQIPLQYIASMMGITQRHLSRLRKNIC
ncbi:Crp/Fnr family transcriptional regulator [Arenibacter echinorum]|uniref:CRP-like cAMP-binding protein n=1 Tax=Arenibacter echinorum TaxID=440515 RepID=A0A327QYU7_9FLAO|nr:Crp/Fnr family transcriptional regulator [Arenibacter echinorum]RAJ08938.1 CRP-like cAMP-binding protein [Arenibacter echinorum]